MRRDQALERGPVVRTQLERFAVSPKRFFILRAFEQPVCRFTESLGRFAEHALLEIAFAKLESDFGVLRIEVGDLVEHHQSVFTLTGASVGIGNYEILRACVGNQSLGCIEIAKLLRDCRIARFELFDLAIHRDGLEPEFLFAIVFGYPQKAAGRFLFFGDSPARQKISQHVESGEIAIIMLDDLPILFNGGANLSLSEEFFSGLYDLSFFESHKEYYVSLN